MEFLIGLIFAFFVALGFAAASLLTDRPVRKRLARLADGTRAVVPTSEEGGLLRRDESVVAKLLAPLAATGASLSRSQTGSIRRRLIEAGYRAPSALTIYMGSRVLLALVLPVLMLVISSSWDLTQMQLIVLLCGSAGLGLVAPSYWVDKVRSKRQTEIILGLPDALDLMVVCVEAGLGVNASLARVSREFARANPILAAEFELVSLEVRAGKSSINALRSLADRTGVAEVGSLVAMLVQTERFGTSLADTLRVHADSMRSQRMLRAEEQAGKAPLKMLFPTLVIFIATLIVTIGPGLLQMFAFFGEAAD